MAQALQLLGLPRQQNSERRAMAEIRPITTYSPTEALLFGEEQRK